MMQALVVLTTCRPLVLGRIADSHLGMLRVLFGARLRLAKTMLLMA
jgi:hypothetical protein